jgi:hypothetical protein
VAHLVDADLVVIEAPSDTSTGLAALDPDLAGVIAAGAGKAHAAPSALVLARVSIGEYPMNF